MNVEVKPRTASMDRDRMLAKHPFRYKHVGKYKSFPRQFPFYEIVPEKPKTTFGVIDTKIERSS